MQTCPDTRVEEDTGLRDGENTQWPPSQVPKITVVEEIRDKGEGG